MEQVADGMLTGHAVRDRLAGLEGQRAELEGQLAQMATPQTVRLHPKAANAYRVPWPRARTWRCRAMTPRK